MYRNLEKNSEKIEEYLSNENRTGWIAVISVVVFFSEPVVLFGSPTGNESLGFLSFEGRMKTEYCLGKNN